MNLKAVSLFISIFLMQFIMSCDEWIDDCNCSPVKDYNVAYSEISVDPVNIENIESLVTVTDTVSKENFGIIVAVDYDRNEIVSLLNKNYGFSSAMACSCITSQFLVADSLDYIEVFETSTSINKDVTQYFKLSDSEVTGGTTIQLPVLPEYFFWDELPATFLLEISNHDSISNSSSFTVDLYLKSGERHTAETTIINFFD